MDDFLRFALLGLGVGAIYGLTAQGLVLIFLGNRVLNFAQGAIALLAAYVYYEVSSSGIPLVLAAVVAVVAAAVVGALIELLVMRPLRDAASLTRLVATIGLLTVIQSAAALRYGDTTKFVKRLLPADPLRLGGSLVIGTDRALLLLIGLIVTVVMVLAMRRTRFGLATLASAENPRAVEVLGWSAQRISLINWILGATLAGLAGVLIAPINGLSVAGMGQIVYGALAAALIGSFRSFGWAMGGGLILGVAQAEAVRIHGEVGWSSAIPFLVIVAAVLLRRQVLTTRGNSTARLPAVGAGRIRPAPLVVVVAAVTVCAGLFTGSLLDALVTSLIAGVLTLSLVVSTGYTGEISLAQYTVAGVAGLVTAHLAGGLGLPFVPAAVGGVVTGVLLGMAVAACSVRVRGDVVAIVTLGLALALQSLVLGNPSLTGGVNGVTVPPASVFGLPLDGVGHPQRYAVVCALAFVLAGLTVSNLRRGVVGRRLIATRASERAAATMGISAVTAKTYALAVAGGLAGLAGALAAFRAPLIVFDGFSVDATMMLLVAVALGGAGYIGAAPLAGFSVTGGIIYFLLTLTGWQQYLPLGLGLLLLVNMVLVPDGLVPQNVRMIRALAIRLRRFPVAMASAPQLATAAQTHPEAFVVRRAAPAPLGVRGLGVSFGGVKALEAVELTVRPGQVEGLIGPNGAGKTTLIDAITGISKNHTGTVTLAGEALDGGSAAARARRGVTRTLQGLELFEELTVFENLLVGAQSRRRWPFLRDLVRPAAPVLSPISHAVAQRFELESVFDRLPGELPYGQRRLVAIARAISTEPSVLLMDEPAAGLSGRERLELADLIKEMAHEWGIGILLVEHDVDLVMNVCDHITVIEFGRVIARGAPSDVREDPEVRRAFLGTEEVTAP